MYGPLNTSRMIASLEHSAPATTSLWPLRYFVAECATMSMPSAIGDWFSGLA